jgi:hypothetical protein
MQLELSKTYKKTKPRTTSQSPQHFDQYGPQRYDASGSTHGYLQPRDRSMSPHSVCEPHSLGNLGTPGQGVDANFLDERLRRLNVRDQSPTGQPSLAGQRITEYENALTPSVPRQALGFKVIKRADNETARVNLDDFPNGMCSHMSFPSWADSNSNVQRY